MKKKIKTTALLLSAVLSAGISAGCGAISPPAPAAQNPPSRGSETASAPETVSDSAAELAKGDALPAPVDGYSLIRIRYQDADGNPIKMVNRFTSVQNAKAGHGKAGFAPKDKLFLYFKDSGGVLTMQLRTGGTPIRAFSTGATRAPIDLTLQPPNATTFVEYVVTHDESGGRAGNSLETIEHD